MSTYTARSREVTARPRSQRLREVGANGVQTVSSGGDGSSQPRTWEKDVLTVDGTQEAVITPVSTPLVSVLRFTDGTHIVTISLDQNGYLHIDSGLWSDSFISALGTNSSGGGGGGGGIDADAMWGLLQNAGNSEKINIAHLPTGTTGSSVALGNHTHSQYLTAITKAMVEAVLTGDITSHSHAFSNITGKPTTLSGYGITDAVQNEVVAAGDCNNMYPSYAGLKSYRVTNGAALANAPFGQTGFMMIAGNWSGYQMQLAMSVTSARMYYRYCQSGTWSAWSAVAQTSDITFGNLLNKPTTIAGYGITDAMTQNGSTTNADFNELTVPGCYTTNHSTWTDALPVPAGAYHWGTLLVLCNDNDPESRVCQMYMPHQPQGYGIWTRTRNNGSWTAWSAIPTTDGNIASATKLQTARTLWGNAFNGTANVSGSIIHGQSNWAMARSTSDNFADSSGNNRPWYGYSYVHGSGDYNTVLADYFGITLRTMSTRLTLRQSNGVVLEASPFEMLTLRRSSGTGYGAGIVFENTAGRLARFSYDGGDFFQWTIGSGNTEKMRLTAAGVLTVTGTIHATSGIYSDTYVSALGQNASDIRLKRNIRDFEGAAAMLMRLRFVQFQWNDEARRLSEHLDTECTNYGLVAQEAEEAGIDGLVYDMPYGDKQNRYKGVRYEKLIPIMAATIQQQQRRIDDLEARLARLEEIVKRVMSKE